MTFKEIKARVQEIKELSGRSDHESAHSLEDDLFKDVLNTIAKGSPRAQKLAKLALESTSIQFPRHAS